MIIFFIIFRKRIRTNEPISNDKLEKRTLLLKEWAKYKHQQHLKDIQMLDRIMYSQQRALDELRKESEELYQEAIQVCNWISISHNTVFLICFIKIMLIVIAN